MADKKHVDYKVPGGKLIRMDVEIEKGVIRSIKITGDFFIHPEDSIEAIEGFLTGKEVSEELAKKLEDFLEAKGTRMIGISAADIVASIKKLLNA